MSERRSLTVTATELLEGIKRLESRVSRVSNLQEVRAFTHEKCEEDRELLLEFVKDVWLNKYPTKPRVIAAAGRLLDKIGQR